MNNPSSIKFKFDDKTFKVDADKLLSINDESPDALARQLKDNPSVRFYWGSLAEYACARYHKLSTKYELWYAKKYAKAKKEMLEEGEITKSKLTETMVKQRVILECEEEYQEWQDLLQQWDYYKRVLGRLEKGLKGKHEALINLLSFYKHVYEEED